VAVRVDRRAPSIEHAPVMIRRSLLALVLVLTACSQHDGVLRSELAAGSDSDAMSPPMIDATQGSGADAVVVDSTIEGPVLVINLSIASETELCDSTSARCDAPDVVCSVPDACQGGCLSTWSGSFGDTDLCTDDGMGNWTCPGTIGGCASAMLGGGGDDVEFETVDIKKMTIKNKTNGAIDVNILKADLKIIQKVAGGTEPVAADKQLGTDVSVPANDSKILENVKVLKVKGKDLYVVPLLGPGNIRFKQVKVDAKAGTMEMEAGTP
jgi:hypothetical protein